MSAALALALVADTLRTVNARACYPDLCVTPTISPTKRCAYTDGYSVIVDPICLSGMSEPELALTIGHEWAHIMGARAEREADRLGMAMAERAGYRRADAVRLLVRYGAHRRARALLAREIR